MSVNCAFRHVENAVFFVAIFCITADRVPLLTSSRASLVDGRDNHEQLAHSVECCRKPATYQFTLQRCQLCENPTTVYQTRYGLLDHVKVHHEHLYSSDGDILACPCGRVGYATSRGARGQGSLPVRVEA